MPRQQSGSIGRAVKSIKIINAHKKKGHGCPFLCPITRMEGHLAEILLLDDTDFIHIDMDQDQLVHESHTAIKDSIVTWGNLLISTGGSLKPIKCFYHVISFSWIPDVRRKYETNEDDEELDIAVPMPDKSLV